MIGLKMNLFYPIYFPSTLKILSIPFDLLQMRSALYSRLYSQGIYTSSNINVRLYL